MLEINKETPFNLTQQHLDIITSKQIQNYYFDHKLIIGFTCSHSESFAELLYALQIIIQFKEFKTGKFIYNPTEYKWERADWDYMIESIKLSQGKLNLSYIPLVNNVFIGIPNNLIHDKEVDIQCFIAYLQSLKDNDSITVGYGADVPIINDRDS